MKEFLSEERTAIISLEPYHCWFTLYSTTEVGRVWGKKSHETMRNSSIRLQA
jgi:hypothetical protein